MILAPTIRVLRYLGWIVLAGSVGVVIAVTVIQAAGGPEADQKIWPTPRLWRYYVNTLWMAASATIMALVLSLPAAFALVQSGRPWQRRILHTLTILPLVTMPSIFAYAWMLLATRRDGAVARVLEWVGWNTPGVEPLQAAWVLATWLWPIPALILATTFKHVGAGAYRLACLDASPVRAFLRGALPVMRAPLIAAAAFVFILVAIDTTIPPLMLASETWSTETVAMAGIAGAYDRPVAFLAWHSWPILVTVVVIVAAAAPGICQMARWADDPDVPGADSALPFGSRLNGWSWAFACLIAAAISVFPIVVFASELGTGLPPQSPLTEGGGGGLTEGGGGGLTEGGGWGLMLVISTAYKTCGAAALATLLVAALVVAASMVLALAMLDEPNWPLPARLLAGVGVALTVAVAVLPPELIGTALVAVGSHPRISPRDQWNLYDNTPLVWTAAMIARFGFLPVCLTRLLNRRAGADLAAQACTDGAGPIQRIAYTRLPFLWRPLLAGCLMVGCLTLSESAAGVLVQPPQFFGGSLAVHVDAQMHYGRQNETIALSLMLMIPAVLAAVVAPLLVKLPGRFRRAGGTTGSRRAGSLARRLNGSLGSTGVWCVALAVIALLAGCERADPDVTAVDAVFGGPGLGTGEFSYPRGIAVSPVDGCVFVVDKSPTARIQRFSPDGEYEHQWCMPEAKNGKPTGLYVDRHNRVWVPDTHYHRVITYDRDGRELFRFGARGEGPGEFIFPTDVVLDREGNIYVGEYGDNDRISKFSPDREYLFSFADKASGEGRVERPTGLAIDEDNTLWVADACHHRICRYGPDGRFLRAFGSPGTERDNLNYPYGLVLEGSGTLLVADRGNNRIVRFDRAGNFVGSWGIHGRDRGQISQPWGVAVAEDGRVYCLDSWNNRVQLIDW